MPRSCRLQAFQQAADANSLQLQVEVLAICVDAALSLELGCRRNQLLLPREGAACHKAEEARVSADMRQHIHQQLNGDSSC